MALPQPKYYWTFDESQGTAATDAMSRATITLDAPSWHPGHLGGGVRFNPQDGAKIGTTTLGALRQRPWTVAFWVWREADTPEAPSYPGCSSLFFHPDDINPNKGTAIRLEQWGAQHRFGISLIGVADYSFEYKVPLKTWTHVVLVGTDLGVTMYADGQPKLANWNGTSMSLMPVKIDLPLSNIGSMNSAEVSSAILDELRVYDQELTAAQVTELYNLTLSMGPKLMVTVDGKPADNKGSKDLGAASAGQAASANVVIVSGTKATVEYSASGGVVSIATRLPSTTDTPVAPGAMQAAYTLTLAPKDDGPLSVMMDIKSEDTSVPEFTYTVSVNGGGPPTVPGGPDGGTSSGLPNDLSVSIGSVALATGGRFDVGTWKLPMTPLAIPIVIHNNTKQPISLLDVPPVVAPDPGTGFTLVDQPKSPILAEKSQSFNMLFGPPSSGPKSGVVSFRNSAADRSPFTFTLTGSAAPGLHSKEQTIACSGYLMAILRPNGDLWARTVDSSYGSRPQWVKLSLPEKKKPVAIDIVFGSCIAVLTDTGEIWVNRPYYYVANGRYYGYIYSAVGADLNAFDKAYDGCLLFSLCDWYSGASGPTPSSYLQSNPGLVAIKSNGDLVAPGAADLGGGSSGGGFTLTETEMLKRGNRWTMALKKDGTVRCWGANDVYQCGSHASTVMVRPGKIEELAGIVHIDACQNGADKTAFGLAVDSAGKVWGWGVDNGCLGLVKTAAERGKIQRPAILPGLPDVKSAFAGNSNGQAFAIDAQGYLWSWGYADDNLGRSVTKGTVATPDLVPGVTSVESFRFSGKTGLLVTKEGTPYWFGYYGGGTSSITPVRMDEFTSGE